MHAAIIAEDFAGMRSQGRGLAERAGFSWAFHPAVINREKLVSRLPVRFWPHSPGLFAPFSLSSATRLIISVGGKGAVAGAALGKRHGLPVVQIQHPRARLSSFALVVASQHDRLVGPNVLSVRTAMHDVTPARLDQAAGSWKERIRAGADRVLGVLLGGSNGRYRLEEAEAVALSEELAGSMRLTGARCVLTPSRRTSHQALAVFRERLVPLGAVVMEGDGEDNPYMGVLACSDVLAVTQDSVSMMSEAVATDRPVCILRLKGRSSRLEQFVTILEKEGRVQSSLRDVTFMPCERLDDTSRAADEIHHRIQFSQEG
ncbi:mitochondrial fission ELM1 family protein [Bombella sp. TMW 2.2559]|uniref:Mitochondrial fission ELM1 family protein n=1 Tax=Bombella dulcis TaxID=2967339 RepID=A0ABT3W9B9_9PROT|nr:mitochondrial fission ELM1 family protein [Bombella dulcis]MCX5615687.1 mitochondrial fission ELM1 family protein [Bombella dulcis]